MNVSVIVPTYNRANLIIEALKSIQSQTYSNIEIIIVDDGSSDSTETIVSPYINNKNIFYYKQQNGGCSSARNYGLKIAKGKYIAFLDSDDLFLPMKIEKQLNLLISTNSDYCVSDVYEFYFNENLRVLSRSIAKLDETMSLFDINHFMTFKTRNCAVLYNRRVFEEINYREDLYYNEDSDLLQKVAIKFKGCYLSEPTAFIRNHSTNKSKQSAAIKLIYDAQIKTLVSIYNDNKEFAQKLGETLFEKRIKDVLQSQVDKLRLNGDYLLAEEIRKSFNLDYGKSIVTMKYRDFKNKLIKSNPIFWGLYSKVKKEF